MYLYLSQIYIVGGMVIHMRVEVRDFEFKSHIFTYFLILPVLKIKNFSHDLFVSVATIEINRGWEVVPNIISLLVPDTTYGIRTQNLSPRIHFLLCFIQGTCVKSIWYSFDSLIWSKIFNAYLTLWMISNEKVNDCKLGHIFRQALQRTLLYYMCTSSRYSPNWLKHV